MCWKRKSLDSTFTCCVSNIGCQLLLAHSSDPRHGWLSTLQTVLVKARCARNNALMSVVNALGARNRPFKRTLFMMMVAYGWRRN